MTSGRQYVVFVLFKKKHRLGSLANHCGDIVVNKARAWIGFNWLRMWVSGRLL
jgi:hypothetical protein